MDPYEQAIGRHLLIDPTLTLVLDTPESDTFNVVFDYNNGTGDKTTVEVGRRYTFHHFTADGKGEYQRDSEYDFGKDTYIRSEYTITYTYPQTPTNSNPNFKGWYNRPVGGQEIDLNNITEATTVYAQYTKVLPENVIELDGEEYTIPDGVTEVNPINEGYGSNQIVKKATLTLILH